MKNQLRSIGLTKTWWGFLGLLLAHQLTQKWLGWQLPFLDNYLDPFLSIPILLGAISAERNFILQYFLHPKKNVIYQYSLFEIIILSLFFALLFEEGFPYWSKNFIRDNWDYLAYFSGACVTIITSGNITIRVVQANAPISIQLKNKENRKNTINKK